MSSIPIRIKKTDQLDPEGRDALFLARQHNQIEGWVTMDQTTVGRMSADKRLNLTDLRVLLYIIATIEAGGFLRQPQSAIANVLSMARPNVANALKRLVAFRIIAPAGKLGTLQVYQISPHLAYRGSHQNTAKVRAAFVKEHGAVLEGEVTE
jgi:hypothetical protein